MDGDDDLVGREIDGAVGLEGGDGDGAVAARGGATRRVVRTRRASGSCRKSARRHEVAAEAAAFRICVDANHRSIAITARATSPRRPGRAAAAPPHSFSTSARLAAAPRVMPSSPSAHAVSSGTAVGQRKESVARPLYRDSIPTSVLPTTIRAAGYAWRSSSSSVSVVGFHQLPPPAAAAAAQRRRRRANSTETRARPPPPPSRCTACGTPPCPRRSSRRRRRPGGRRRARPPARPPRPPPPRRRGRGRTWQRRRRRRSRRRRSHRRSRRRRRTACGPHRSRAIAQRRGSAGSRCSGRGCRPCAPQAWRRRGRASCGKGVHRHHDPRRAEPHCEPCIFVKRSCTG